MGYVLLQGREPFDLVADRLPSAVAVNGLVAATVPIYAPGLPGNVADVRILLNPQQAEDLGRQLLLEAKKARGARASPSSRYKPGRACRLSAARPRGDWRPVRLIVGSPTSAFRSLNKKVFNVVLARNAMGRRASNRSYP